MTGTSRRATNPANAILNYLYAIAEAEARLAPLAVGCDPGLGIMHADQRSQDSLACDLMEPSSTSTARGRGAWRGVNRDGHPDLVLAFRTDDTGIAFGDTRACLTGEFGGETFRACDAVEMDLEPSCGKGHQLAWIIPVSI